LTDGIPRKIKYRNRTIKFKKTAPKSLSMKGKISRLVVAALKEIGKDNITEDIQAQLAKVLKTESLENINHDARLAPTWISKIMLSLLK